MSRVGAEGSSPGTGALAERGPAGARSGSSGTSLPHVVAWNLTRRCNLACAHCYISAGSWHARESELDTDACLRILDQVLEVNPNPMLILTGGEPLLRDDLEELARHATEGGATVVVGTNGTRLTHERIESLKDAGVKGVAVSVDSLDPDYHDRFRHGEGSLQETLDAVDRLREHRLDFVVQTTLTRGNRSELGDLATWSARKGAISFNLYFIVPTGRADRMRGLEPQENEDVLREVVALEREHRGRMMVRTKCQPQLMRHVMEEGGDSPLLNYATRCPCGVHYCRITPEGKVTPCPYMPLEAGDLTQTPFRQIWESSPVFTDLREGALGGRCGRCEYRKVCGGCRARAYAETGDPLGPDDSCAYDPGGEREVIEPPRTLTYGQSPGRAPADAAGSSPTGTPPDGARDAADGGAMDGGGEPDGEPLPWTEDARERVQRIPSFVRGVVTSRVEKFARERGYERVDTDVMAEVRRSMPVDFSKRLPFFLQKDGGRSDEP